MLWPICGAPTDNLGVAVLPDDWWQVVQLLFVRPEWLVGNARNPDAE
jgi:hypothetical protein